MTNQFDYTISSSILLKELTWQPFEKRMYYFLCILAYQCIYGLAPSRLSNEIEMYFDRHGFDTRNADSLRVVLKSVYIVLKAPSVPHKKKINALLSKTWYSKLMGTVSATYKSEETVGNTYLLLKIWPYMALWGQNVIFYVYILSRCISISNH